MFLLLILNCEILSNKINRQSKIPHSKINKSKIQNLNSKFELVPFHFPGEVHDQSDNGEIKLYFQPTMQILELQDEIYKSELQHQHSSYKKSKSSFGENTSAGKKVINKLVAILETR
jgi:hypothetical protein